MNQNALWGQAWFNEFPKDFQDFLAPFWRESESNLILKRKDIKRWQEVIGSLPSAKNDSVVLKNGVIHIGEPSLDGALHGILKEGLWRILPWRKGPFSLFGLLIDSEWRSDLKWQRLLPHLPSLKNASFLDVGCSNGYHLFCAFLLGARFLVGFENSWLYALQYQALHRFCYKIPLAVLPKRFESEEPKPIFDCVSSMGVLYHNKDPLEHLKRLTAWCKPGGCVILETLVSEQSFTPKESYAKMRNVHQITDKTTVQHWLKEAQLQKVKLVSCQRTSPLEQRSSDFMPWESLAQFLDPHDSSKTIEGYPAPIRALWVAQK